MSLLNKVLKLAQSLDQKGLTNEADVLDKFATYIANGDDEVMLTSKMMTKDDVNEHDKLMSVPWMTEEIRDEVFQEFKNHFEAEGHDTLSAVRMAISEMNQMMRDVMSPMAKDEEDEYRQRAESLTSEFAGLS